MAVGKSFLLQCGALLALAAFPAVAVPARAEALAATLADKATVVRGPIKRIEVKNGRAISAPLSPPDGATIYDNETEPIFFLDLRSNSFLEEVALFENATPFEITDVEFGVDVSVAVPLKIVVRFWNSLNPASTPVNSGLLRSEIVDFGSANVNPQFFVIREQFTTPLLLSDPNIAVQFDFMNSVTGAMLNGEATLMFAGGGPLIGSSPDWFFRDVNADGIFGSTEKRTFAGNPGLSNFMMHLRGAENPNAIDPGTDFYQTPANGLTFENFTAEADLFNGCPPPGAGYSSQAFTTSISLQHKTLITDPPDVLGNTDTIIRRNDLMFVNNPGDSASSQIEIVALSLQSPPASPVTINFSNGTSTIPTVWDVFVCLSNVPQPTGNISVTRSMCTDEGGTFQVTSLPVVPKLIFSRRGASPGCSVTVDQATRLNPPPPTNFTFSGKWLNYDPVNMDLIQEPVGDLVQADVNCDGIFDAPLAATTSTFHPGVRVMRCTGSSCANSAPPPVSRRATALAPGAQQMLIATLFPGPDADHDNVPDASDNCGGYAPQAASTNVANPNQSDVDDDGYGDACDNCLNTCNPDQANADGDAFGDACDCNPADATNAKPAEAANLRVNADKATWTWNALALATSYNVLRGTLPALPVGPGGAEEICFTNTSPTVNDTAKPTPAAGFWYLARGKGVCGGGTYGKQASHGVPGAERVSTTCP